jgi:O-antigen ligase
MRARGWLLASMIVLTALILTLTRGLIISTSFSIIVLLVIQRRYTAVFFSMILVALAAFAVWVYLPSANDSLVNSRVVSNQQRLDDMDYMLHYATLKTVLLGEGYGTLIDYRMNIENTFMWALWKLGILGLAFWVMPFVLCLRYFLAIPRARSNGLACGFLCGTVLIYTQTMTNPFLNNPIGLSFVIMSIFSLRTMAMSSAGLRVAGNGSRQSPSGSVGTYPEYVLQPTLQ